MSNTFETLGNASVIVFNDGNPIIATDPWLSGTCYFGSWALDHPMSPEQIDHFMRAEYIWISHGHPDHLHDESLARLPRGKKFILPAHYTTDIADHLRELGFDVTTLAYRTWFPIAPKIRVLCLDNINQDGVLIIEADGALIVDLNDSPLCGEDSFLRNLIRQYKREKVYLLALCSVDADMFNFIDETGQSIAGPPEERKPGAIWNVARMAGWLGVGNFCCSSSQHVYVRADSVWANPYRIGWNDMKKYWSRPEVRLIEPFATVDTSTGQYTANYPSQQSDFSQVSETTGEDDWQARLNREEWDRVTAFIRKFEMIDSTVDFVEFVVGGEARRIDIGRATAADPAARGVIFHVPKQSLLITVEYGYFDDLLIGNFMKTRLINTSLYPRFSPLVAKTGGNAKVFTRAEYRRFRGHYFRRNPVGMTRFWAGIQFNQIVLPWLRTTAERVGVKGPLKILYRKFLGDPVGTRKAEG